MRTAVLLGPDPSIALRLARLATEFDLTWVPPTSAAEPALVVVDLDGPGAAALVGEVRARWPAAILACYLTVPDPTRWEAAQRAGCDLVANRGALPAGLRRLLAAGEGRGRRFPLVRADDLAGRLGLVTRVADTPVGPVAVYHVEGRVCVVDDRCPHAGAVLSAGELDGRVLTCPRHGSRFDVVTGERVRGPADADLLAHPVVVEAGQVSIVVRSPGPPG